MNKLVCMILELNPFTRQYVIDTPVILMLLAKLLDATTTTYFVQHNLGYELNPTLAALIKVSFWIIPFYIMVYAVPIPLLENPLRRVFAYYFTVYSLPLGVNNLWLILFRDGFIFRHMSWTTYHIFSVLVGLVIFLAVMQQDGATKEDLKKHTLKAGVFCLALAAIEGVFYAASILR